MNLLGKEQCKYYQSRFDCNEIRKQYHKKESRNKQLHQNEKVDNRESDDRKVSYEEKELKFPSRFNDGAELADYY